MKVGIFISKYSIYRGCLFCFTLQSVINEIINIIIFFIICYESSTDESIKICASFELIEKSIMLFLIFIETWNINTKLLTYSKNFYLQCEVLQRLTIYDVV